MITDPVITDSAAGARRRARRGLTAAALALIILVAGAAWAVFTAHHRPVGTPTASPHVTEAQPGTSTTDPAAWDLPGEAALAARPMLALPEVASAPQPLAGRPASGSIPLSAATGDIAGVPAGFPNSPDGAVAALAALTAHGLRGADPQSYIHDYQAVAAPGAPPAEQARLTRLLRDIRSSAGIPATGPVAGLSMGWQPLQAQIKGVLDGGRYVVACVLGEFTADYQGRLVAYGVGDCQALRWMPTDPATGAAGQWLISPGPAAATAPDAWPGSQDSVDAGYLEIR